MLVVSRRVWPFGALTILAFVASAVVSQARAQHFSCPPGYRIEQRYFCVAGGSCPPPTCVPVNNAPSQNFRPPRAPQPPAGGVNYRATTGSGNTRGYNDGSVYRGRRPPPDPDSDDDGAALIQSMPDPTAAPPPSTQSQGDPNNPWRADCRRQNPTGDPFKEVEACRQADLWDLGRHNSPTSAATSARAAPPPAAQMPADWAQDADEDDAPPADLLAFLSSKAQQIGVSLDAVLACIRTPRRAVRCLLVAAGVPPSQVKACAPPWPAPCMGALIDQYGKAGEKILAQEPKW